VTAFRDRLAELYADGIGWPCLGLGELFVSDDPHERQKAAPLCMSCRVLVACRLEADANGERFGVWAGADRTLHTTRKARS
jgi:WhiB family redox-sensing transcriptional regulator